jgi:molecular chaperone DnaK
MTRDDTVDDIILGIDLGTTYSAVAYVDEWGTPRIITNSEGNRTTPSVVLIDDDRIEVGEIALNLASAKPDNIAQWVKRAMGDADYRFLGMSAIEISAEILKKLRRDAERAMSRTITKAVITCPAYFASPEVKATRQAGELAGFSVREIVREPTAAAVYYGVDHLNDGERLLIYDLGGGTFDATILSLDHGVFNPLATAGDRRLGGHDWTAILLDYVCQELSKRYGIDPRVDPLVSHNLYCECERAKRDLSRMDRVTVPCVYQGQAEEVSVSQDEFIEMTEWRLEETLRWVNTVLHKLGPPTTWADIDGILLVGGSTRMPRVLQALKEISGKDPIVTGEADTMVALGAAILAKGSVRIRSDKTAIVPVTFERKAPRNLGTKVIVWEDGKPVVRNSTIIPCDTRLPARMSNAYQTSVPNQQHTDCPVVESDDCGPEVVIGTYRFTCLPGTPTGTLIAITFSYDGSGVVEVTAVDERTGTKLPSTEIMYQTPDLTEVKTQIKDRCVVFALDVSGSMDGDKLVRARQALIEAAANLGKSGGNTKIGVVTFGSVACSLCRLTRSTNDIDRKVKEIRASGGTAMHAGIDLAARMLLDVPENVIREIVLVTDGMPDDPSAAIGAAEQATSRGISILGVGIGHEDVNEDFLRRIAPRTLTIAGVETLSKALMTLLTETRYQPNIIKWGTE